MRILVAADQWFPDFRGGSARVAAETARRLAGRGHEVVALVPHVRGEPAEERSARLTVLRVLRRYGLPQTAADVAQAARHARGLRDARFDVVVAHESTVAVGLSLARLPAPLALVYHASVPRELRFARERIVSRRRRLALRALDGPVSALDRRAVSAAAAILVLSEFTRTLVAADHPEALPRVGRVFGGVDVDSFSPGDGPAGARRRLGLEVDGPLLVTVRRLDPRMGLERLIEALPLLGGHVRLAVVGDGLLRDELPLLARRLGVAGRVGFAGQVPDEQLQDWYRAGDVFVLPTVAYEGFGLVTAEALASGTPVVGTPVGATPELLAPLDERLVAGGSDPAALAAAIGEALALATPPFRRACREYAVARFAWQNVMPSWEEALAAAAAASPGASRTADPPSRERS